MKKKKKKKKNFYFFTVHCDLNKTCIYIYRDHHDITETLLKVALNTIKQTNKHIYTDYMVCFK